MKRRRLADLYLPSLIYLGMCAAGIDYPNVPPEYLYLLCGGVLIHLIAWIGLGGLRRYRSDHVRPGDAFKYPLYPSVLDRFSQPDAMIPLSIMAGVYLAVMLIDYRGPFFFAEVMAPLSLVLTYGGWAYHLYLRNFKYNPR